MDYGSEIEAIKAQREAERNKVAEKAKVAQAEKEKQCHALETIFKVLVVDELEKLATALNENGIHAETGNGHSDYGSRRSLYIESRSHITGIVFQCFTQEPIIAPYLAYYYITGDRTHEDYLRTAKHIGRNHEITSAEVGEVLQDFMRQVVQ